VTTLQPRFDGIYTSLRQVADAPKPLWRRCAAGNYQVQNVEDERIQTSAQTRRWAHVESLSRSHHDSVSVKGGARLGCLGRGIRRPLCQLSGANPHPFQMRNTTIPQATFELKQIVGL
jgi:hypothetical protein